MSAVNTTAAHADEAGPQPGRSGRSDLRLVPRPLARMPRLPFLVVLAAFLGLGMVGLLLLNTTLQTRAFTVTQLQREATTLGYSQSELETQVAQARSPQRLAELATALGMRPNPYPAFVELPSGKVHGVPHQVTGAEMTSLKVKSPILKAQEAQRKTAKSVAAAAKAQSDRFAQLAKQRAEQQQQAEKKQQAEKQQAEKKQAEKKQAEKKQQAGTGGEDR